MNSLIIKKSQETLQNYFELNQLEHGEPDYQKLLEHLTNEVAHLIDHDFERLLFVLYRIDVSEKKVKEAIAKSGLNEAPQKIAALIIERQMQKVKSRQEYSNQN